MSIAISEETKYEQPLSLQVAFTPAKILKINQNIKINTLKIQIKWDK